MRIIAGKHKGRRIELPKENRKIRPTSEFAREAIFNLLIHGKSLGRVNVIDGARLLDIFSGSGALGLEALSRGAVHVTFIDSDREAIDIARRNIDHFGEASTTSVLCLDATQLNLARATYDIALMDPPYHKGLIAPTLRQLLDKQWLKPGAIIIMEHDERETVPIPEGYEKLETRRYGRAVIEVLRAS